MSIQIRRDVFQAIADPTRRDIITLIAHQQLNQSAIADHFDVSRPAISQHIKILTDCGIIIIRQQGRERFCELQPEQLAAVANWVEPFRKMWEDRFNKLDDLLDNLQSPKNKKP